MRKQGGGIYVARIRRRQQYCSATLCQGASKRASQARWLAKPENRGYFMGAQAVAVGRAVTGPSPLVLALQVLAGATVYLVLAWLLRGNVYRDAWSAAALLFDARRNATGAA